MNSKSKSVMVPISLKSKRSNKKWILSSAEADEKIISPENISSESINPLLSSSKMANVSSLLEKMLSNSVKFIAKLSQILLKPPWSSRILGSDKFVNMHLY